MEMRGTGKEVKKYDVFQNHDFCVTSFVATAVSFL